MPCNSCGGLDHERRSSKLCENQIPTKKQRTDAMFQPLQNQILGKLLVLIIVDGVPKRSMFVIKDNLHHSLMHNDNHQTLENIIQNLVSRARDISFMASLLDGVHTLRMMENAANNIFPIEHNQSYYLDLFKSICGHHLESIPNEIIQSLEVFRDSFGNHIVAYNGTSSILTYLAMENAQNFKEHISRNLSTVCKRLFIIRMNRDNQFQETDETKKKLANHVYKRLGRMETF
jgi:hypothetical protein